MTNFVPKTNKTGGLGTSSKMWKEVNHVTASFDTTSLVDEGSVLTVKDGSFAAGTVDASGHNGSNAGLKLGGTLVTATASQINVLGSATSDGEFLVATGAGALAYESGATVRTSLGLGTGDSPTFTSLTLSAQATDLAMNNRKITGLAAPAADGDAANKSYVDGVAQGLDVKDSVRAATDGSNITIATDLNVGDSIDGVTLADGDRVLVKDQTTASENGIYIAGASPARSADMAAASQAAGVFVFVEEGTLNADAGFVCTTDDSADTVGTHSLAFSQFSGAGSVTAGDGLDKTGNTLAVKVDNSTLEIDSDTLKVKAAGITNTSLNAGVITGQQEMTGDVVDTDELLISDNGALKKVDFSVVRDAVFNDISGDATVAAGGALTIGSAAIETAMVNKNVITGQTAKNSVADGDLILIADAADSSNLKKMTKSTFVAGLGGASAINDLSDVTITGAADKEYLRYNGSAWVDAALTIVDDTTPQLGGALDVNGKDIVSVSSGNITLTPHGTGVVRIDGTTGIDLQSGEIAVKNSGSVSNIKLYCENNNAHYTQIQSAAHATYGGGNVTLTLPISTGTLVGTGDSGTVTNTMLAGSIANAKLTNSAVTVTAGDGLSGGGSVALGATTSLALDLNELTAAVVDVAADSIVIVDANDSNSSKKESVADLVAGVAGTGLSASSGQLSIDGTVTTLAGSQTLTNKTLTSVVLNTGVSGTAILDEDNMTSDSATQLATQQSIKAYVDSQVAGGGLNIDGYNAHGSSTIHQTQDHFVFSSNGTETKLTFSNLEDAIFGNISSDATVAAGGALTIAADAVTYAKMQNVSATNKLLGRSSAGAGVVEEIACTAAGRALLDDADAAAQRTTLGLGNVATLSTGISNTNILQANADVVDDDFLRVSGTSIEGRSAAQVLSDIGAQSSDAGLTSIAGLTTAANKMIYTSAHDTYAVADLTAAGRALLDDANAAAQRTTLGLGTSATLDVGTGANNIVQLNGSSKLPAVDGSLLTNLPTGQTSRKMVHANNGNNATYSTTVTAAQMADHDIFHIYTTASTGTATFTLPALSDVSIGDKIEIVVGALDWDVLIKGNAGDTNRTIYASNGSSAMANTGLTVKSGTSALNVAVIEFNSNTNKMYYITEIVPATLDLLANVSISSVQNNQTLTYNSTSSKWENSTPTTGLLPANNLNDVANAGTARTNLGLAIGSNVQAHDAALDSISGLTTATDKMIYTTNANAYAVTSLTAAGRALLDDADAAAQRTTLGLGTGDSPTFTSLTLSGQAGALAMNSQKITGLADPASAQDAATKSYVDGVAQGLSAKDSVRAATTEAETLASDFANGQAIDGVTLATGDRILIKNQAAGAENGIYTVNASGAPTRAVDFDANAEVAKGAFIFVEEGTTNADAGFVLTTDGTITLGTTALAFTQFSGAGDITAGSALTKSGNTLNVAVDDSSIEVSSDALRVKASGITSAMLAGSIANSKLNQLTTANKVALSSLDLDGGTDIGADLVDADLVIVDDGAGGTNRKSALSRMKKYIFSAISGDATASDAGALSLASAAITGLNAETTVADDDLILISDTSASGALKKMTRATFVSGIGGTATDLTKTSGNITIDAQDSDADIIFKGTDGSTDTTFLTLDGSDAGTAIFNHDIKLQSDGAKIFFGADNDVSLFHLADTGLVLDMTAEGSNEPEFTIRSQGNTVGPELKLASNSSSNGSTIATINFNGYDSNNNAKNYASIFTRIDNGTYQNEEAKMWISGLSATGSSTFAGLSGAGLDIYRDLGLIHDGTIIKFGSNSEIQLAHVHNEGLTLKHTATGDDSTVKFTLQTGETDIQANDVIGAINFQAPDEGTGTDAILVCAGIEAVSEGDFSASNNATKLSFKTGASETAAEKMSLSSTGNLTVTGDLILDDGGSIKEAGGTAAITIDASGEVTKIGQDTPSDGQVLTWDNSNSKVVWSAAGGSTDLTSISSHVVPSAADTYTLGSASAEWADLYLGDSSKIYFGNDQDVFLEHVADNGLILDMGVAEGNNEPRFKIISQGNSTFGSVIELNLDKTAPAATNRLGSISFTGKDDAGNFQQYGLITCLPIDDANGSEVGEILISPAPSAPVGNNLKSLSIKGVAGDNTKILVDVESHNGSDAGLKLGGTLVTASAAEINVLDGVTAGTVTASKALVVDSNKDLSAIRNLTVDGDIILDDGGSIKEAGGTAAITIDASGEVTKIGQDSPSDGQFLQWDGSNSKVVWAAASGGGSATIPDIQVLTTSTPVNAAFASIGSNGDNERVYLVNNGSTAVQINLPAVSGNTGKKFQIKRLGTANVTIAVQSGESLETTTNGTFVLTSQYSSVTVVCNASGTINGWYII